MSSHACQLSSVRLLSLRLSLDLMMLPCQSGSDSLAFVWLVLKSTEATVVKRQRWSVKRWREAWNDGGNVDGGKCWSTCSQLLSAVHKRDEKIVGLKLPFFRASEASVESETCLVDPLLSTHPCTCFSTEYILTNVRPTADSPLSNFYMLKLGVTFFSVSFCLIPLNKDSIELFF